MSIKHKIASKLNGAIRRTHWFNEELFPDCRKFWNYNTFNTDVINLGSTSGCHAFDYEDLPIPEEYKIRTKMANLNKISSLIDDIFVHYNDRVGDFDFMRRMILDEHAIFVKEIENIFIE